MREYGLIGYPLGHSFSPAYFREKFAREGVTDSMYTAYPLESLGGLRDWLSIKPEIAGLNVTIPHKQAVIAQLDWVSPEALAIGAVNTIRIRHVIGEMWLEGYNTDAAGFQESLTRWIGKKKLSALVFGTGGSSRAVCYVLDRLGIGYLQCSRRPEAGQLPYAGITPELATDFKLWINTTPVGMAPEEDNCLPLPFAWLSREHYCFDLIYNPAETSFLRRAQEADARTKNGLEMLHLQADEAWKLWQETDIPDVFRELED